METVDQAEQVAMSHALAKVGDEAADRWRLVYVDWQSRERGVELVAKDRACWCSGEVDGGLIGWRLRYRRCREVSQDLLPCFG